MLSGYLCNRPGTRQFAENPVPRIGMSFYNLEFFRGQGSWFFDNVSGDFNFPDIVYQTRKIE